MPKAKPIYSGPVDAEEVRRLFDYDPASGEVRHRVTRYRAKAGTVATHLKSNGYLYVSIRRRHVRAHRAMWLWMTGAWPVALVDHRDLDTTNLRWENLREATKSQNGANMRARSNAAGGLKGVKRDKKRWSARIKVRGVHHHLGNFDTPEEAHAAYVEAANLHFGEFARAA